jgi:nitrite reductase/ring-hydroxylating ferredoxin subunit
LVAAKVSGRAILLGRVAGATVAFARACPHMGLPLTRGAVRDGAVRCPFHGSRFSLTTGENLDWCNAFAGVPMPGWSHKLIALGQAPAPLRRFPTKEEDGGVWVEVD